MPRDQPGATVAACFAFVATAALLPMLASCRWVPATDDSPTSEAAFPDAWLGTWAGTVTARNADSASTFDMRLTIATTDDPNRLTWANHL